MIAMITSFSLDQQLVVRPEICIFETNVKVMSSPLLWICCACWGPEHILTLNTVNNLGILYTNQGKLDEAKKML
jgi:hypothetical protein